MTDGEEAVEYLTEGFQYMHYSVQFLIRDLPGDAFSWLGRSNEAPFQTNDFEEAARGGRGLPPLEAMFNLSGNAYAAGGGFPLRFGLFFWGNGNLPDRWNPVDEGADWTLSEQLEPLAAVKDLITVVTGMRIHTDNIYPHTSGASGILTGCNLLAFEDGREWHL